MDNLSLDELKNVLADILEIITCPVCHESLRPPAAVCENGHSTCLDCRGKIRTCPLCSKPFVNMKIRQLDNILEAVPHSCRFEGCQVFVKKDDDHEKFCKYRKADCKIANCKWTGCVQTLSKHIEEDHKPSDRIKGTNFSFSFPNIKPFELSYDFHTPVLAHGECFWMHITNDQEIFKLAFYCLPIGKIVNTYKIVVTLQKQKKTHSTSVLMLPEDLTNEEENCICLPSSFIQTFINTKGQLLFNTKIEKN